MNYLQQFKVLPGTKVKLKDIDPAFKDGYESHEAADEEIAQFQIPADHKWFRNLAVARIVVEYLEALNMKYPKPAVDIEHIRREYHAAEKA